MANVSAKKGQLWVSKDPREKGRTIKLLKKTSKPGPHGSKVDAWSVSRVNADTFELIGSKTVITQSGLYERFTSVEQK